jgi:death-on-curing protein
VTGTIRFLSRDEALAIHARLIERFGGPDGVRDLGLLESALHRPQTGHYVDLVQMAAALFESLLMNHPFVDGNKRVAFFATDVFLRINGWRIEVNPDAAHGFLMGLLEQDRCELVQLETWLRKHVVAHEHE